MKLVNWPVVLQSLGTPEIKSSRNSITVPLDKETGQTVEMARQTGRLAVRVQTADPADSAECFLLRSFVYEATALGGLEAVEVLQSTEAVKPGSHKVVTTLFDPKYVQSFKGAMKRLRLHELGQKPSSLDM